MTAPSRTSARRPSRASDGDDALVAEFQLNRSPAAVNELLRRHEGLIASVARRYYVPGGDGDDVRQQAMIGFWKAVRDYRSESVASFPTFAHTCMQRHLVTAVRAATRHKHAALTGADRLGPVDDGDGSRPVTIPAVGHEDAAVDRITLDAAAGMPFGLTEIERLLESVGHEAVHDLLRRHFADRPARRSRGDDPTQLSENEAHVLVGMLSGKKYAEIADEMDRSPKFVDNTVQRLRGKLRHLL